MAIIIIFLLGISTVSKNRHKISLFRVLFKILVGMPPTTSHMSHRRYYIGIDRNGREETTILYYIVIFRKRK